jgi:hypothetical protein
MKLHLKVVQQAYVHKFDLRIQENTKHKECLAPALETKKTADKVKKSDIPITQIGDKV